MKKYFLLCVITLCVFHYSLTRIIETDNFEIIYDYADPNTLIVFDIDNTLARTGTELGSDEWFCHLVEQKEEQGHDHLSAIYLALPLAYYAQFNLSLQLTDLILPTLFNWLKDQHINIIGLTSRGLFLAERTYEQLNNIGLTFLLDQSTKQEFILPLIHPCLYKYDIIFCSNNDKGEALLLFFDMTDYHPTSVIFFDDRMHHVIAVDKALTEHNINCLSVRYTGCDGNVHNFDPAKAEAQLVKIRESNNLTTQALETFLENC